VTFLFTDIEGSTRRWEADAAAMRAALLAHDEVLRTAIESHGGFLFSHTGDGVVAAFASPMSAVDAAVKAQLALELPVRMGIATGEAELRDGNYFGTVLNRAARVMAAGHGGQVLLAGGSGEQLRDTLAHLCHKLVTLIVGFTPNVGTSVGRAVIGGVTSAVDVDQELATGAVRTFDGDLNFPFEARVVCGPVELDVAGCFCLPTVPALIRASPVVG
jgi:hypothetical protein